MIIDTSALIAVFKNEPGSAAVSRALEQATTVRISAATLVELTAVLVGRQRPDAHERTRRYLDALRVETVPFDAEQAAIAQRAYRDYGRGSGSRARLNLGDCYSYALATAKREPLLYVGDDFAHTDIPSAL